jgi:2-amino-4-hydroxy-6-hydroxymethyldihydropteridine diphosphokinase
MNDAFIGLGSNLQHPLEQLKQARSLIRMISDIKEIAFSRFYRSPPMGPQDQPDYVNAVMHIQCCMSPLNLLHVLQEIEQQQGRRRTGLRWGARTLDLDLLLFDEQILDEPELVVPHPGMKERSFVLYPLQDIVMEDFCIPGQGRLADLIEHCPLNGLEVLDHDRI